MAKIEAMRADLAGYRAVQGASAAGGNAAVWTAYFDGTALKCIDETSNQTDGGAAENEYYFESGVLVAYVSRGTRSAADPSRAGGEEEHVTLRLAFDTSGAEKELSKTVEGRPAALEMTEVAAVRSRAAFLAAEAARTAANSPAHPPPVPKDPSS